MSLTPVRFQSMPSRPSHSQPPSAKARQWAETCQEFMFSIPIEFQERVDRILKNLHDGGPGLRAWVASIAWRGGKLPETVPVELLQVYFNDPEAIPLHECETCGIAIPIRPNRLHGMDSEPEQVYFDSCPVCSGRTGLYLFISRCLEVQPVSDSLRRGRPR